MKKGRSSEVAPEVEAPTSNMDPGLLGAAEDLLSAIQGKSPHDIAQALKAAFSVCESYEESE